MLSLWLSWLWLKIKNAFNRNLLQTGGVKYEEYGCFSNRQELMKNPVGTYANIDIYEC